MGDRVHYDERLRGRRQPTEQRSFLAQITFVRILSRVYILWAALVQILTTVLTEVPWYANRKETCTEACATWLTWPIMPIEFINNRSQWSELKVRIAFTLLSKVSNFEILLKWKRNMITTPLVLFWHTSFILSFILYGFYRSNTCYFAYTKIGIRCTCESIFSSYPGGK